MGTFEAKMAKTALAEGGYVNDPSDRGGETNHGVTVAVARAFGYRGAMRDLTKDTALEIYRARYWIQPGFDLIDAICPGESTPLS
jgi:lysozyme family protein